MFVQDLSNAAVHRVGHKEKTRRKQYCRCCCGQ